MTDILTKSLYTFELINTYSGILFSLLMVL